MYRYRGKTWSEEDMARIRELIAANPQAKRVELARMVCEAFDWRGVDGRLKEMCCRDAMLKMWRDERITLPSPQRIYKRPARTFSSPESDSKPEMILSIGDLSDLRLEIVTRGRSSTLWNESIARYHYLGFGTTLGAQIRYFIVAGDQILGAMAFGGAAWKVAPRDQFIGWTAEARQSRLHLVVNQTRFLIFPWVRCHNLATKSLSMAMRRISGDWLVRYGYSPVLLETFVEDERFRGTCYKAGNWVKVGVTQGRGRMDRYSKKDKPIKSIWLMPLRRDFREILQGQSQDKGPRGG